MFAFFRKLFELIRNPPSANWHVERRAKPSTSHPLAGFWKRHPKDDHGLAIGPAEGGKYYISFCGPGGCFEEGKYRLNSTLQGDPDYRIIDMSTIEVKGKRGFNRYVRVKSRV